MAAALLKRIEELERKASAVNFIAGTGTVLGNLQQRADYSVFGVLHNWGCTGGAPSTLPSHRSGIVETKAPSVVCSSRYRSTWLGAYRNATGLRRITSCLFPCRGKLVPVTASGELWRRIGQFQCLLCVVAGAELRLDGDRRVESPRFTSCPIYHPPRHRT